MCERAALSCWLLSVPRQQRLCPIHLQPAQEESKDKAEMIEEGEGMGEHHIPSLHLPVSLVVWRIL